MRLFVSVLAMTVLVPATSWAQPASAPVAEQLVGTWRLVRYEDLQNAAGDRVAGGQPVYRYGDAPLGLFVYTADGYVAIQIAHPDNPRCVFKVDQRETILSRYVAYWGTYTVDASARTVVHHVRSDLGIGYTGTDQRRPFRLEGDRLVLGDGKTWTRVLERVRGRACRGFT